MAEEDVRVRRLGRGESLELRDAAGLTLRCCAGVLCVRDEDGADGARLLPGECVTLGARAARVSVLEGAKDEWLRDIGFAVVCLQG